MRLKLLLATVFVAGLGASYALADDGHGQKAGDHGSCTEVHVHGTVAAQTLTVTLDKGSHRLNLAPGAQVVLQLGGAGQTVRVNAEACSTQTGTTTTAASTLQVKSAELKARKTQTTTTTAQGTTTAP